MAKRFTVPDSVHVLDGHINGRDGAVPVRRYRPADGFDVSKAVLVWAHGGAFAWGGLDQLESHAVASTLAAGGREVIAVDYRLSPRFSWFRDRPNYRRARETSHPQSDGYPYPAAVYDLIDTFAEVSAQGPSSRAVLLGGASAGACVCVSAAMHIREQPDAPLAGLVLAYGTFHAALPPIKQELRARTKGRHSFTQFSPAMVARMNANYAIGEIGSDITAVFPGGADLRGLPRTTMIDADRDTLRASGHLFAQELVDAGVDIDYTVSPETTHGFLDRPTSPAFVPAIARIEASLARHDNVLQRKTELP